VSDDLVLAAVNDGRLVAFRRESGEEAWTAPIGPVPAGMPVAAAGLVWSGPQAGSSTGSLRASRLSDGSSAWSVGENLSAPAVAGGLAVSSSADGVVSGRDATTGEERWRTTLGGELRQVAVAGTTAFVLAINERQVYGLDTATGARRWQVPLDAEPGCCIAVAQGVLAVGTTSGRLTVFESGPDPAGGGPSSSNPSIAPSGSSIAAEPGETLAAMPLAITATLDRSVTGIERPLSVALAPSGDIYLTDTTHHVTRLAGDGTVLATWGGRGTADGQFDFGVFEGGTNARGGIAVGPDGLVYVSDADNHRVQVFTADGVFVRSFGSLGSAPGQFTIPFDLNVDQDGNVYVLDDGAERITKVAPDGTPLWIADQSTDPRLFGHAHTAAFDNDGRLVVTMDDTETIVRLDPGTGAVIDAIPGGGCDTPVDPWDRLFVLDCDSGAITVRDPQGTLLVAAPDPRLLTLRFREDGAGVAVADDGSVLLVRATPP
jgi:outer membrane protein assembly factor BamB